ncbi:MAG: DEAD/DEAH box helicase [Hyphomicrobiaceae bacterium]
MTTFNDLGLAAPLLKALNDEGYETPTPIQAQAIPSLLAGRDLLGIAQTGTGKTAAFALPILHRLSMDPKPAPRRGTRVLVLAPTRELASQIAESFETYGRHLKLRVAVVFGGVGYRPQREALNRGLDVLVATPGRLLDHVAERTADLRNTEVLVLDEADQMLDLGFIKPIREVVATLPAQRQNLLFSATMPREITGLADQLLRDPVKVAVTPVSSTVERVAQRVIHVDQSRKRALLAELMADATLTRGLVFTRTKRGADRVAKHLESCGVKVAAIHGNKSQNQRETALGAFRLGRIRVLVATDIAARGIDVDEVSHVVNFELPEVPEAYVHRIGRTGRAGASGVAISLCAGDERDLLRAIERTTRQTIPSEDRRGDTALEADVAQPRDRSEGNRNWRDRPRNGAGRGSRNAGGRETANRDTRGSHKPARDGGVAARSGSQDRRPAARNQPHQERSPERGADRRRDAGTSTERTGAALGHMRFFKPSRDAAGRSERPERGGNEGQRSHGGEQATGSDQRGRRRPRRGGSRPAGQRMPQAAG